MPAIVLLMGCVYSTRTHTATRPPDRTYHVVNVDDRGNEINAGHILITETDLILRQGESAIHWPLRSVPHSHLSHPTPFTLMYHILSGRCVVMDSMRSSFPSNVAGDVPPDRAFTLFDAVRLSCCSTTCRKRLTNAHHTR